MSDLLSCVVSHDAFRKYEYYYVVSNPILGLFWFRIYIMERAEWANRTQLLLLPGTASRLSTPTSAPRKVPIQKATRLTWLLGRRRLHVPHGEGVCRIPVDSRSRSLWLGMALDARNVIILS
jgi:hypothetical protein